MGHFSVSKTKVLSVISYSPAEGVGAQQENFLSFYKPDMENPALAFELDSTCQSHEYSKINAWGPERKRGCHSSTRAWQS